MNLPNKKLIQECGLHSDQFSDERAFFEILFEALDNEAAKIHFQEELKKSKKGIIDWGFWIQWHGNKTRFAQYLEALDTVVRILESAVVASWIPYYKDALRVYAMRTKDERNRILQYKREDKKVDVRSPAYTRHKTVANKWTEIYNILEFLVRSLPNKPPESCETDLCDDCDIVFCENCIGFHYR